jgi:protease IV
MPRLTLLLILVLLPGCSRLRFTVSLGPEEQILRETTVLADKQPGPDKVALIDVRGVIADAPAPGLFGDGPSPIDELVARLDKAAEDPAVKALIIRINSPGGTVTGSDIMHREVRRFSQTTGKPVVALLGEIAASGGYYLALAADEIVAHPTGLTGSIGVIFPTLNVSDGLSRIGIRSRAVTSGPNKDLANPLEPIREAHYQIIKGIVEENYARFRALVVERRPGLDTGRLDEATDGRIVTGSAAVAMGLADSEGSVREAFDRAQALAGIEHASLVKYTPTSAPRPRTAYAQAGLDRPRADDGSLVHIDVGDLASLAGVLPPNAYYLWIPAAE